MWVNIESQASSQSARAYPALKTICFFAFLIIVLGTLSTSAQECRTIQLSSSLQAISWPVLLNQDKNLLAIDGASGQVVKISMIGPLAGEVQKIDMEEERPFVAFSQVGDEIVQVYGDSGSLKVAWYNKDLGFKKSISFGEEDLKTQLAGGEWKQDRRRLLAPYRWIVTEGHLVGYGVVSAGGTEKGYGLGFFDQPLPSSDSSRIPQANLFHPYNNLSFYTIGNPFIVGLGNEIFFLELGSFASLYRFDLASGLPSQLITGLPGENTLLKDPEAHMIRLKERELLMQRLDVYEGPWGLYEQQGTLHLLTRQLNGTQPEWRLRRLEIENNRINQEIAKGVPLKSRAQQLVLVPTSNSGEWILFEQTKGRDGTRQISTMKKCQNLTLAAGSPIKR